MNPNSLSFTYYVKLSVNGAESPLGIGIDAGSAIASIIGTGVSLAGFPEIGAAVEVIGGLLGAFQYTTTSVAQNANYISIHNDLPPPYYVNVCFNNLTPVYTVSGQRFTLPNELILINVTS